MPAPTAHSDLPIVVLASGEGTNLQAILDNSANGSLPVTVAAVISNRSQARALTRARAAGVAAETCLPAEYPDRKQYDTALIRQIGRASCGVRV